LKRITLGLLAAPMMPTIIIGLFLILLHGFDRRIFLEGIWFAGFSAIFSYPIAVIFGLPILFAALRYGYVKRYHALAVGLMLGSIPGSFFGLARNWTGTDTIWSMARSAALMSIPFMIWGAIVSTAFWIIARPDKYRAQTTYLSKFWQA
jgi:hypothetical protein